jgi:hypothetical protein
MWASAKYDVACEMTIQIETIGFRKLCRVPVSSIQLQNDAFTTSNQDAAKLQVSSRLRRSVCTMFA